MCVCACVCVSVCVCACVCINCKGLHLVSMSTTVLPHVTIECLFVLEVLVALRALELSVTITRGHRQWRDSADSG